MNVVVFMAVANSFLSGSSPRDSQISAGNEFTYSENLISEACTRNIMRH